MFQRLSFCVFVLLLIIGCSSDDSDQEGIFFGDVLLTSQNDINEFGSLGYTRITGFLEISPGFNNTDDIVDLSPLDNLSIVDKSIFIVGITNIDLLRLQISEVGGIGISDSDIDAVSFPKLSRCTRAGIDIRNCPNLQDIDFTELQSIKDGFTIANNASLLDLDGFSNLSSLGDNTVLSTSFEIKLNPLLSNIQGLSAISSTIDYFFINNNPSLVSLDGLENLEFKDFNISSNSSLVDLCSLSNELSDGVAYDGSSYLDGTASLVIIDNLYNPNIQDFINGDCSQ